MKQHYRVEGQTKTKSRKRKPKERIRRSTLELLIAEAEYLPSIPTYGWRLLFLCL